MIAIKRYVKGINDVYSFSSILLFSYVIIIVVHIIDLYNIPTQIIDKVPKITLCILIIGFIIFSIIWLCKTHFKDLLKITSINILDMTFSTTFIFSLLYIIFLFIINELFNYKLIITLVLLSLSIIGVIFRLCYFTIKMTIINEPYNIYDLKSIYYNESIEHNQQIFIAEEDVDYDLLKRDVIIKRLYNAILTCKPEKSFVISLEGDWGSGKTTILNNVKRQFITNKIKNIIIIDEFDPWVYGTQESLLLAIFDIILKKSGMKYSHINNQILINELSKIVVGKYVIGGIINSLLYPLKKHENKLSELKDRLNNYLELNNKIIVFFIDNIDRADSKNIIFLFKLISRIFDLKRIIYVLSYDKKRINNILKNTYEIDEHYLEKIIQLEINVPYINKEQIEALYVTCLTNIFLAYDIAPNEIINYKSIMKYICAEVNNLRQFKRLINSTFYIALNEDTILDKHDLFIVEIIRFLDTNLYENIYKNREYFISKDIIIDIKTLSKKLNKETFNKNANELFSKIITDKSEELINILSELFPYVKAYKNKTTIDDSNTSTKISDISSAKYFDLYFNYGKNDYLTISVDVVNLIKAINKEDNFEKINIIISSQIKNTEKDQHKEWFEKFHNYINEINSEQKYYIAKSLYINLIEIDSSYIFMSLNAQSRALVIISHLLEDSLEYNIENFIQLIHNDFKKLRIIKELIYWLDNSKSEDKTKALKYKDIILDAYKTMCEEITNSKINLYNNYYYYKNIWGLYYYQNEISTQTDMFKYYISSILDNKNIYRILGDVVSVSFGDSYKYCFKKETIDIFFNENINIYNILRTNPPKSQSEIFIEKVYIQYLNGTPDIWGDNSITVANEIKLDL